MLEWQRAGEEPVRAAVLLRYVGKGEYRGVGSGPDGYDAHMRVRLNNDGDKAGSMDLRVMRGNGLIRAGSLAVGHFVTLPESRVLRLHGLPHWVRLHGSRDPSLWPAYAGFALILTGATLIFAVVPVDTCVSTTVANGREQVVVALRAQRFVPLFRQQFEQLVHEQGGSV